MRIASFIVAMSLMAESGFATEIIAHRGYSCGQDENTVEAVLRAWRADAHAVELDLRVSADGALYLFHDDEIEGVAVAGLSLDEVRQRSPLPVQELSDVFGVGVPTGTLYLDLKGDSAEEFVGLASLIGKYGVAPERIALQSPNIELLATLRAQLPGTQAFYLSRLSRKAPFFVAPGANSILRVVAGQGIDGVSLKGRRFLDQAFVRSLQDAGLHVNVWTINDSDRAAHYGALGVDGIITDAVAALGGTSSELCITEGG